MRIILSILSLITIFHFAQAQTIQDPGTPEERAEHMTTKMQEELSLTPEQIPAVKTLNLKYAQIVQTEIIDKDLNIWAMYNKGTKINKQKEKELKPLLNDTQWKKYEQMRSSTMSKIWARLF